MLKDYGEMIEKFGERNAAKVFMLLSGVRFYPILDAEGFGLHAPIGVVVEDEEAMESIVGELCGFSEPIILSLGERQCHFANKIDDLEYELLAVFCKGRDTHNLENLLYLNDLMISKCTEKGVFMKLPLIFFRGGIQPELSGFLAGKVIFEGRSKGREREFQSARTGELLRMFCDYWPIIYDKINDIINKDNRKNAFLEACEEISLILLNAYAKKPEEQRVVRMFKMYADTIINCWNIKDNYSGWIDKMRELMLKEGQKFTVAENRNKIIDLDGESMENKLIFDEKYYYITESMFALACSSLGYFVGQLEMKNALAEAGILVGEGVNRKYYSVKLPISTPNGVRVIGRRMRIRRDWLDRPGELSWAERILLRRRKEE